MACRRDDKKESLSRSLSYLLRHGAAQEGIPMSPDGYVYVSELLRWGPLKSLTLDSLREIVENNSKKRFELDERNVSESATRIRAVQGHSFKYQNLSFDALYTEISNASEISVCIHGTTESAWRSIRTTGLNRMERTHIHMSSGLPGESEVISGMRSSCRILIYVDTEKSMNAGIRFVKSKNGVILSEGENGVIKPKFFLRVIDRVTGNQLLP